MSRDVAHNDQAGDAPRPWERPGAVRRHCAPHRGPLLWWLATASVACGMTAPVFGVTGLAGAALGLTALLLGRRDLTAMRGGCRDPAGHGQTERAMSRAEAGIALSLFGLTACAFLSALAYRLLLSVASC
ncbi:MAG TPA: hypothetical protein VJ739_12205 [Gemmataceae bacterium]|nr:hypothetical protein [Gemmataceae bacterium]